MTLLLTLAMITAGHSFAADSESKPTAITKKRMPAYLLDDPEYEGGVAGKDRRWRSMLWKPKVNARFNKLIAELGRRTDKHPALAAVVTTETAGNPGSGYTAQKCVDGIKATLSASSVAFPATPFMYGFWGH